MYHFFGAITNKKGYALTGYFVQLTDSFGSVVSIYSDNAGTPIINASGQANMALVDTNGNASFYVAPGTYTVNIYSTDAATIYLSETNIPMGLSTVTLASGSAVDSRSALSGVSTPVNGQAATLTESGYEGAFVFSSANLSTQVTADPTQINYVAPSSDTTGASGAWVRKQDSVLRSSAGAAVIGESTGGTVQAQLNNIGTKNEGTLPASTTYTPFSISKTATVNSSGTSDWRSLLLTATLNGTTGASIFIGEGTQLNVMHTSGTLSFAIQRQGYVAVGTPSVPTTTGNITNVKWMDGHISHTGSGTIDTAIVYNSTGPDIDVGTGHINTFHNFHSADDSVGAGRINTELYGFFQANFLNDAPICAAFGSQMAQGTNRWSIYFTGGASSAMAGRLRIGGTTAPTEFLEVVGGIRSFTNGGQIASIGFATSAGGAVTQLTNKNTDVTLNNPCGQITLNGAALAAGAVAKFNFNNTQIAASDTIILNISSGMASGGSYNFGVDRVSAGSCRIYLQNISGGSLSETLVFNFAVIKAVAA